MSTPADDYDETAPNVEPVRRDPNISLGGGQPDHVPADEYGPIPATYSARRQAAAILFVILCVLVSLVIGLWLVLLVIRAVSWWIGAEWGLT